MLAQRIPWPGVLIWALLAPVAADIAYADAPQRVVSLNLCTDELLLALADRSQIASVTWLVKDPAVSWSAEAARGIAHNYGSAAEIVPLNPDLVVAGTFTTRTAVAMLRRLQVPVLELDIPATFEQIERQITELSAALGHPERGHHMVAAMRARLAALGPPPPGPRPVGVVYRPNGFAVGAGSLVHTVLERAGLENLAAQEHLTGFGPLPLEVLVMEQPDLLIMNSATEKLPSLAHDMLRHPALQAAFAGPETTTVPTQSWNCGTPIVVDAIERLRRAAEQWRVRAPG